MRKNNFKDRGARWFSQWSRKAYAIFASVNRVVHIGCLSADVLQMSVLKSSGSILGSIFKEASDGDDGDFEEDDLGDALLANGLLALVLVNKNDVYAACGSDAIGNYI